MISVHGMINLLGQMKIFLVELINRLPYFIVPSIDWYDGLKTELDFLVFCSSVHYRVIQLNLFF